MPSSRQLRIIGGKWRSRRFQFPDIKAIRPTPDKMRETLFNWLQFDLPQATCLDLFAGSGALGLEALSRGAKQVFFIENNHIACKNINAHLKQLDEKNARVITVDAKQFIQKNKQVFDVIFLDPPFNTALLEESLVALLKSISVNNSTLIYLETEQVKFPFSDNLNVLKHSKAGQSHCWLTQVNNK